MGNWNNVKIKTNDPHTLLETLYNYLDEPINPYCEASRDWEMTASIEDDYLYLYGNELMTKQTLLLVLNEIYDDQCELLEFDTNSAIDNFFKMVAQ